MDPQRIERDSHLYEEILSELQHQQGTMKPSSRTHVNRKEYAHMDIESMGVDLKEHFGYVIIKIRNAYLTVCYVI